MSGWPRSITQRPLSGGDRKALNKELGKARAMANILASQSLEMRAKGEALIPCRDSYGANPPTAPKASRSKSGSKTRPGSASRER